MFHFAMLAAAETVISDTGEKITTVESLLISILGMVFVFATLALLMLIIIITAKIFIARDKKAEAKNKGKAVEPAVTAAPVAEDKPKVVLAKGSCGDIKLYNVSEQTAAMVIAIVADELKLPLNELRFNSIKEIVNEEVK